LAADNIQFIPHLSQKDLLKYYASAQVHILPSWFEVCGLSSLEAAAMGCRIVITKKGYAADYFKENAIYCEPESPLSILESIEQACSNDTWKPLTYSYSWQSVAEELTVMYKRILN
jgi:glycosyltransferase involved in cell wall biosynthesis